MLITWKSNIGGDYVRDVLYYNSIVGAIVPRYMFKSIVGTYTNVSIHNRKWKKLIIYDRNSFNITVFITRNHTVWYPSCLHIHEPNLIAECRANFTQRRLSLMNNYRIMQLTLSKLHVNVSFNFVLVNFPDLYSQITYLNKREVIFFVTFM